MECSAERLIFMISDDWEEGIGYRAEVGHVGAPMSVPLPKTESGRATFTKQR